MEDIDSQLTESEKGEVIWSKIDGFDKEHQHWGGKADLETAEPQKSIYKSFSEIAKLQADKMRLENNERPISEEGIQILNENAEESDLGRLEKLKKLAKENLLGLSAVSISVAGIITAIIINARNALKQGAKGVGNLGKAIANIGKNLKGALGAFGAVISAVLNLISEILSWGKVLHFLLKINGY